MTRFFFYLILLFLPWLAYGEPKAARDHVNLIQLDNQIISPVTAQYIERAITRSEEDGAVCLILKLDTPGGLLESTRTIVKRIMNARVPVIVYVAPSGSRAGSAGVFITLAAHIAAMAPSTNIGAAHPVVAGGENTFKRLIRRTEDGKQPGKNAPQTEQYEETDPMAEKIVNDTVAWISTIARTRNRNVEWAKKAVTASVSVTEEEAVREHIVDLVADDVPQLLSLVGGRTVMIQGKPHMLTTAGAEVIEMPMTFRQQFLATIVNPNVAYILMMLGVIGLIFEFTHPGVFFPGIAGFICILLALYAFQALPVNYVAVALLVVGLAMLIAEIKIVSHGLLAIGGIIAMTLGSLMLFESPLSTVQVSLSIILSMVLTLAAITLLVVTRVVRSRAFPVATGQQGMVGEVGEALTDLAPDGLIFVHGETWSAASAVPVSKGQPVRVVKVEGLHLTVEPLTRENAPRPQQKA